MKNKMRLTLIIGALISHSFLSPALASETEEQESVKQEQTQSSVESSATNGESLNSSKTPDAVSGRYTERYAEEESHIVRNVLFGSVIAAAATFGIVFLSAVAILAGFQ